MNLYKGEKRIGVYALITFLLFLLLCSFVEFDVDNYYHYQWGLKNNGNFYVDRGVLADDYEVLYFDKSKNDTMFFDDPSFVDSLKENSNNPGMAYATSGIDVGFEMGYAYYKNILDKRDVVIAIIDSGIDINHKDLKDSIWVNEDEVPDNDIDDDKNGYVDDVNGWNFYNKNNKIYISETSDLHGTHAAGTIVAKHDNGGIKGLAYDSHVKIMPIKILGDKGKGSMGSLINAIRYAKANGANICNISLGSYAYDARLDEVIKENPDMIFVVAAGNGAGFVGYSLDEHDVYPAKLEYDNVICVGNCCFDGDRYISSNYGSHVDVFAPGTFILSTTPNDGYGFLTGTSMAAPYVTATCALLYSAYKDIDVSQYKNIIVNAAVKIPGLKDLSKGGLLNIVNTLVLADTF